MNRMLAAMAMVLVAAPTVFADEEQPTPLERLDSISLELDAIDGNLRRDPPLRDDELAEARDKLPPLQDAIDGVIAELEPDLNGVNARLEQLGAAPTNGAPAESPEVREERKDANKTKQVLDDGFKRANLLALRARELSVEIAKRRRELFSASLSGRTSSIIGFTYWRGVGDALPSDWKRFRARFSEGAQTLGAALHGAALTRLIIVSVLAVLLVAVGRKLAEEGGRRLAIRFLPASRLRRTLVGLWTVVTTTAAPVIAAVVFADALRDTGALTPLFTTLLATFVVCVRIAALMHGLARAWLSPNKQSWRMNEWTDEQVDSVRNVPLILGIVVGARVMWERANDTMGTSLAISVLGRTIITVAIIAVFAIGLRRIGRIRIACHAKEDNKNQQQVRSALSGAALGGIAWLTLVAGGISILLGYSAFGIFLIRQLVQVTVVFAWVQLLIMLTDDLFDSLLSEHFPLGAFLRNAVGVSAAYISQIAVLLSGISRIVLVYLGVRVVLLRLGGEDVTSVAGRIQDGLTDLKVGEVTISPGAILGAILVFTGVWLLTRAIRQWLENSYLPHTQLDSGARNSLSTGIGYLGFIGAVLMAVAYLGVSFDKVALIASALSVGIGFGLQAIISNFVSGLILLVERPIKVGDQVSVSGSTGDVKKISVRATEIQLGDGSTFVVPNSELISKPVVNKTRIGARGQVQFLLRVAYGVDPTETRDLILDVLRAHEKILKDPGPSVFIDDVDNRGFVFNVMGNVSNPRDTYGVRSDLFFSVTARLRDVGIPLANPLSSQGVKFEELDEGEAATD